MSSEGLSRRGLLTGGAAMALAAALPVAMTMAPEEAEAQTASATRINSSSLTTVYGTSLDAGGDAAEFSNQRNSIGVVVYYGPNINPAEYGDAFAQALIGRGVNARSFAAPISRNGIAVLYQVGPSGIGPLEVREAASSMSRAVELSQARDRLISSSYTPTGQGG